MYVLCGPREEKFAYPWYTRLRRGMTEVYRILSGKTQSNLCVNCLAGSTTTRGHNKQLFKPSSSKNVHQTFIFYYACNTNMEFLATWCCQ